MHCHKNHQAWNYEDKTEKEPLNSAIVQKWCGENFLNPLRQKILQKYSAKMASDATNEFCDEKTGHFKNIYKDINMHTHIYEHMHLHIGIL